MKKHLKNACYLLVLLLVLAGGLNAYTGCADGAGGAVSKTQESTGPSTETTTVQPVTQPPEPEEITPYAGLDIGPTSIVAIAQSDKEKATDLTFEDVKALVSEAVELAGGLEGLVKDGDTVVLKPNLVTNIDYTLPGWRGRPLTTEANGNCTDWRITRAVAQLVRELNPTGKILVMEGSAFDTPTVFKDLNYTKEFIPEVDEFIAIENDSGSFGDYKSEGVVDVQYEDGLLHKSYYLNKKIYEADVFICLPVLKNHWNAVVTGTIKNISIGASPASIYGISDDNNNRGNMVNHSNDDLHKWLADFYTCRPADFTVMDSLQGLENGPTPSYDNDGSKNIEDSQKNMRCILASKDGLAMDVVETNIINWDLESINYLKYLTQAGKVGNGETKDIIVLGKKVDDIRSDFAGVIPPAGGAKLKDKTPPELTLNSAAFDGDKLVIKNTVSSDTEKLDIYVDGEYFASVNSGMDSVSLDALSISGGKHEVAVYSYDKYMNHAEASASADKAA